MKKITLSLSLLLALCSAAHTAGAQNTLKVNTLPGNTAARAIISATDPGDPDYNDGLIIPRVSVFPGDASSLNAGVGPVATAQGMLVYLQQSYTATAGTPGVTAGQVYPTGFYYWSGGTGSPANTWLPLNTTAAAPGSPDWKVTGNTGTAPGTNGLGGLTDGNYLGTTDNKALVIGAGGRKAMVVGTNGQLAGGSGNSYAGGSSSLAYGYADTAVDGGVALGVGNKAAASSLAMGLNNKATGFGSMAAGGYNNASGSSSTALGSYNNVTGQYSQSFGGYPGYPNTSSGLISSVIGGAGNLSAAQTSIAGGLNDTITAQGNYSFAVGERNKITSDHAFATGQSNRASGPLTFVSGYINEASGNGSVCLGGSGNVAAAADEVIMGTMTRIQTGTANSYVGTDPILQLGNGNINTSTRSNALTVLRNGNAGFGNTADAIAPTSTLTVGGSVAAAITTQSGDYTLTAQDYTYINTAAAAVSLTLPDPATCKGRMYRLVNLGHDKVNFTGYTVKMGYANGIGDLIASYLDVVTTFSGYAPSSLNATSVLGNKLTIQSDGTSWISVGQ